MSAPKAVPAAELMPLVTAALGRGQRVRMTVYGGSMLPFLLPGDEVELAPADHPPVVGQICLVRGRPGFYLLHRVVRTAPGRVWTQGDGHGYAEGPFHVGQVLANVVLVRRRGRTWSPRRRSTMALYRLWRLVQARACRWRGLVGTWRQKVRPRVHTAPGSGAASADQS